MYMENHFLPKLSETLISINIRGIGFEKACHPPIAPLVYIPLATCSEGRPLFG